MADNSVFDPGSGGDTYRSKDRSGVKTEIVGLDIGIGGTETLMTSAALADATANPTTAPWAGMLMCFNGTTWDRLRGDTTNGAWVNVKAQAAPASLPLPTGAATSAKQPALGTAGSASTDVLTVQGITSMTALKVDGSAVTQPVSGTVTANAGSGTMAVSAAALPLPSGASTSAKQPALGTAGSASADVLSVQGIASMTALKVDGSAVTQPVSVAAVVHVDDNSGSLTVDSAQLPSSLGQKASGSSISMVPSSDSTTGTAAMASTANAVSLAVPAAGVAGVQVTGTWTGTLIFEASSDSGTTWFTVNGIASVTGAQVSTVTANGAWRINSGGYTNVRVRCSVTGTGTASVAIYGDPASSLNTMAEPLPAGANAIGSVVVSGVSTTVTVGGTIGLQKGSSGNAYLKQKYTAQTTTVQTVKGTSAVLAGYMFYNPNATVAYVQIFDVASATTVTLGTTVPDIVLPIPATSGANAFTEVGIGMTNGIKLACTTTALGSTAPGTGLDMTIFYG